MCVCVCVCLCVCVCVCVDGGIPFHWNSLESRDCCRGNARMGISLVTDRARRFWEEWEYHLADCGNVTVATVEYG